MSFPDALVPDPAVSAPLVRPNILEEALQVTTGPRAQAYGPMKKNHERIARIATAVGGMEFTPLMCVIVHVATKLARLQETPGHRDSLVDLAGYARVWSEVEDV